MLDTWEVGLGVLGERPPRDRRATAVAQEVDVEGLGCSSQAAAPVPQIGGDAGDILCAPGAAARQNVKPAG